MSNISYGFGDFVKAKICQVHAAILYTTLHPYTTIQKISHQSAVEFILNDCPNATPCRTPKALLNLAFREVAVDGFFMEFGVFKGGSISYIAKNFPEQVIHGFDSFEGLPESWLHHAKSAFTLHGKLPKVPKNVILHKGYFDKTLPDWLSNNDGKLAFLHVDCDLYSSTKTVFEGISERVQPGTVILFDDYFNFPNWEQDGHRVFQDFVERYSVKFEPIGYARKEFLVKVVEIDGRKL